MMSYFIQEVINEILGTKVKREISIQVKEEVDEYTVRLYHKLRQTKNTIFRNEPVDFYDNYIPLTLIGSKISIRVTELKKLFTTHNKIGIIGSAGSGKSTLLKFVALECLEQKIKIPILIELRNYNPVISNFENFVASQVSERNTEYIKELFKSNKFVFIFDGYDEINYVEGGLFISEIDNFINKYHHNDLVIASRPGTNIESLGPIHCFHINPLNRNDIYLFIEKINISSDLKRGIFKSIENDKSIDRLLSIPLFLSLYISNYETTNIDWGNKKSIFFRSIIDALFSKHDSVTKLGYVREKLSNLTTEQIEEITSILAFRMFFSRKFQLSKDELFKELTLIKSNGEYSFENDKILFDLTITVNILFEIDNRYVFPHILIVEYLCALFASKLSIDLKKRVYQKIDSYDNVFLSASFMEFLFELDNSDFIKLYFLSNLKKMISGFGFDDNSQIRHEIFHEFIKNKFNDTNSLQDLFEHLERQTGTSDNNALGSLFDIL